MQCDALLVLPCHFAESQNGTSLVVLNRRLLLLLISFLVRALSMGHVATFPWVPPILYIINELSELSKN